MKEIADLKLTGERALYGQKDLKVINCTFKDGESPIKECENIEIERSSFNWMYPVWYGKNVRADGCFFSENTRAGVWYMDGVCVKNSEFRSPKNFRRSKNIELENVKFIGGEETLWFCDGVKLKNVEINGNYFLMNSENVVAENINLNGKYSFDGVKNLTIKNSKLNTKDAFWNSENVTAENCLIIGEYLGWNAKNLTFINCEIESLQGLCYADNLKLINCKLKNTSLAFEYSSVEADICSGVDSVFNPKSGIIKAEYIGELIVERDKTDETKTKIICKNIAKRSDKPDWL
ncbi:MAG: DUF3737 family protein [Clostridia bacterium]|nr:DUF3737 family protein [Clostridia bacterium]